MQGLRMCIVAILKIPIIVERKKERNKKWRTIVQCYGQRGGVPSPSNARSRPTPRRRYRTPVSVLSTTYAVYWYQQFFELLLCRKKYLYGITLKHIDFFLPGIPMCHVLISTRGNEFVRLVLQQCIHEKLVYFRFHEIR